LGWGMTQFPNSDKTQKLQKCVFAKPLGRTPDRVCSAQTESQTRASRKKQPQNYDLERLLTAPCRENHCDKSNHDLSELLQHFAAQFGTESTEKPGFLSPQYQRSLPLHTTPQPPNLPNCFSSAETPPKGTFPAFENHLSQSAGAPNVRSVVLKTFRLQLRQQCLPTLKCQLLTRPEAPRNGGMSKKRQL